MIVSIKEIERHEEPFNEDPFIKALEDKYEKINGLYFVHREINGEEGHEVVVYQVEV